MNVDKVLKRFDKRRTRINKLMATAPFQRSMDKAASTEANDDLPLHRAAGTPAIGPQWHDSIMDAGCPREAWLDGYRLCRDTSGW